MNPDAGYTFVVEPAMRTDIDARKSDLMQENMEC